MRRRYWRSSQLAACLGLGGDWIVSRCGQNGRTVGRGFLFLYFQLGSQDRRGRSGNGNGTGFSAAVTIENFGGVAGGDDFGKRSEWRAHNIDAAHQFIGSAV